MRRRREVFGLSLPLLHCVLAAPAPLCPTCIKIDGVACRGASPPPALLQNVTVPDGVVYGVAALLDEAFNGSEVWVDPLPLDLPGAHDARAPPHGIHMKTLQFSQDRGEQNPNYSQP